MIKYVHSKFHRLTKLLRKHMLVIVLGGAIFFATLIVLFPVTVSEIPVGHAGVMYRPFQGGVDLNTVYKEGVHLKFPWNTLTQYNMQVQNHTLNLQVMTADLLKSNVKITFQYELDKQTLQYLHKYVGEDYLNKIIIPKIASATREKIGAYASNKAFTADLQTVINEIAVYVDDSVIEKLSPPGLVNVRLLRISDVQIADISFPKQYEEAINAKLVEQAKADAFVFKIQAERQEATRKVIEAEGIKKFQEIVNAGLTENFLRFKGIEATQKLADSDNSKVVIFGQGNSGLPLILGDMEKGKGK